MKAMVCFFPLCPSPSFNSTHTVLTCEKEASCCSSSLQGFGNVVSLWELRSCKSMLSSNAESDLEDRIPLRLFPSCHSKVAISESWTGLRRCEIEVQFPLVASVSTISTDLPTRGYGATSIACWFIWYKSSVIILESGTKRTSSMCFLLNVINHCTLSTALCSAIHNLSLKISCAAVLAVTIPQE